MHSILENDVILRDPYEVLCYIGTLIIEGRIPKVSGDSGASSSEIITKTVKPYTEGPHCPTHLKTVVKDTHKCVENNILCIRYKNLRQHMQYLHCVSPSIAIEVSLGPDCLCGELRSQSTLVSTQPSKRDIILEQWTIKIGPRQGKEASSHMSVMNLYQAVRSLLHFSQLTAWYMSTNGTKPTQVIYRVVVPEDSTYIADDTFVNHDLPVVDINKEVSMKISLKTLPRREKIPIVFCPQHSNPSLLASETSHLEDSQKEKSFSTANPLHPIFNMDGKGQLLEKKLPLKFQGVRKKTNEAQERKRKKHLMPYDALTFLELDGCSGSEFWDGIPIDIEKVSSKEDLEIFNNKRMFPGTSFKSFGEESSKLEQSRKLKLDFSTLKKPQKSFDTFDTFSCNYFEQKLVDPTLGLILGMNSLSDSKKKSDFRTKRKTKVSNFAVDLNAELSKNKVETKTVMDILDDRMQISCAISGKHHCKWECEEENELTSSGGNVEKPKRRRSLSQARANDEEIKLGTADSEIILHGKFKEMDSCKVELCSPPLQEENDFEKSKLPTQSCSQHMLNWKSPPNSFKCTLIKNSSESTNTEQTPKIKSLPRKEMLEKDVSEEVEEEKNIKIKTEAVKHEVCGPSKTPEPESSSATNWVRMASFESFRKGCTAIRDADSDNSSESEAELSEDLLETSNPFLAAILRPSIKSKMSKIKNQNKCEGKLKMKFSNAEPEKAEIKEKKTPTSSLSYPDKLPKNFLQAKSGKEKCEKVQSPVGAGRNSDLLQRVRGRPDFRGGRKKHFAVKSPRDLFSEDSKGSTVSITFTKLKSLLDEQNLKHEEATSDILLDDNNSSNTTKTIPVPSTLDKLKFRRSLDSAAQLVFHRCSGLPLTSSPAPIRRNTNSFAFDSSLNSVSAIKSALFEPSNSLSSEDENESEGSLKSPASPGAWSVGSKLINYHSLSPLPLLGSFEESVLNGRLEPVSTVQGFTAELGASGSFCPRHLYLPVTVFFYTLGDNDKVSAPYLGHINLGKKGYNVPRSGTIQVTLFNPLRTVVKMFVVVYDLTDMPVNSQTFLRQRTLYVPANQKESTFTDQNEAPFDQEDYHKYLRYLIHLRFFSGKTGRIYLHTDIRMVIFRKADEDTATALGKKADGETYELRSHTHGPINPKFSPRK